ncbi:four-helix bundle copper-binding protein [Methylobacterium sp. WL64]|uniref:four-helix bundle copper-binding protein n=1 Tax=Methylobacterium sp. WL64 TaxID=2603894 RepID=UPI0011C9F62D|nr:four-helix bundle copper-binding protein [Methylobacterium sp. WL64]TXN03559.1 four-helix bundle copper-binding protein [Methylobacterium sp. WL64]
MAHTANADMQACIEACLRCYQTCLGMMTNRCVEAGGPHVEPEHVRLMLSCAETCRACAHLMVIGSAVHRHQCRACAEICAACAASCEAVGDMDDCVRACRTCAETCRRMAA